MLPTTLVRQPTGDVSNPYKKYGLRRPSEELGWGTKTPAQQQTELRQFGEMGLKAKELVESGTSPSMAPPIAASEVLSIRDTQGRRPRNLAFVKEADKLMKQARAQRPVNPTFVPQSATSAQSVPSPMLEDARTKLRELTNIAFTGKPS